MEIKIFSEVNTREPEESKQSAPRMRHVHWYMVWYTSVQVQY